jgi:hypothetical protein
MTEPISISTAQELLDFTGGDSTGIIGPQVAAEQLTGAVAIHNLLARQGVAYLADEVGMGKTYVALGALALFRHFDPSFRVLVIAPRENIQDKWIREWRNFVRHIVRVEDLRVKAIGGDPARAIVKATSLVDLASKVARDHDRDFFARLTSFSLPVSSSPEGAEKPRRELLRTLPWLDHELLSMRNKEDYKENFARALNCALPQFDLVIVDEGHNLKGGWRARQGPTRNLVVGCALAGKDVASATGAGFRGYCPKVRRVLFLSATPIEHDFEQLWNQLNLLGHGQDWAPLADRSLSDEEKRVIAHRLLIRRVGKLRAGTTVLTKNQYRREWRGGGATVHDEPLDIPGDRQKLAIALVQKKVSEVLGHSRHNHSFQVGLLASFESFAETARVREHTIVAEEQGEGDERGEEVFYTHGREARRVDEREGMDIDAVNLITRDYQRRFGKALPHPKMDALVDRLALALETGEKALVFVRRVASVDELQHKLEERYDDRLFARLRAEIVPPKVRTEIESHIQKYKNQRAEERHIRRVAAEGEVPRAKAEAFQESSNSDSFFSWFFRGEGPPNIVSGARLADRFDQVSGDYATFFEDNYVATVLGVTPAEVLTALGKVTGTDTDSLRTNLRLRALEYLPYSVRTIRLDTYRAFQRAALDLLAQQGGALGEEAGVVISEVFSHKRKLTRKAVEVPQPDEWLAVETLFTALSGPDRVELRSRLWPSSVHGSLRSNWRERELRRLLFATMTRKGHPIIDLFIIVANRLGSLALRKRDVRPIGVDDLATQFLDLLSSQAGRIGQFCSFSELAGAAANFQLIVTQNVPEVREAPLTEAPTLYGRLLRSQRPVGGMAGGVNTVMVRQFRMPGYPLILVSTDLLQEGEDLHTFCSSVFHYGIAWMPSALEQRVGRIDRVGSQTERRLASLNRTPLGSEKLQVYYPYLRETVEVLQVQRVLHRLNRFLRLMHENLGMPELEKAAIDVKEVMLLAPVAPLPIDEPLVTAFDVTAAMLHGRTRQLSSDASLAARHGKEFADLIVTFEHLGVTWLEDAKPNQRSGIRHIGERLQPFTLLLRSLRGIPVVRCVSPVGEVPLGMLDSCAIHEAARRPFVRVSLLLNERIASYEVAVEGDVIFDGRAGDSVRVVALVESVTDAAEAIEQVYTPTEPDYDLITKDLPREADVER